MDSLGVVCMAHLGQARPIYPSTFEAALPGPRGCVALEQGALFCITLETTTVFLACLSPRAESGPAGRIRQQSLLLLFWVSSLHRAYIYHIPPRWRRAGGGPSPSRYTERVPRRLNCRFQCRREALPMNHSILPILALTPVFPERAGQEKPMGHL